MRSPAIRNSTFDTTITAADIDRTVQFSGAVARRFTLPDIDGTSVALLGQPCTSSTTARRR